MLTRGRTSSAPLQVRGAAKATLSEEGEADADNFIHLIRLNPISLPDFYPIRMVRVHTTCSSFLIRNRNDRKCIWISESIIIIIIEFGIYSNVRVGI